MPKHWADRLQCQCGMKFRTAIEEARHRHNFPALCRRPAPKYTVRCSCGWTGRRTDVLDAAYQEKPCPHCGDTPDRK